MKVHARHHRVLATSVLLAIAGPSLAQPVTVDTITQSLPGESVSQLVERVTPLLQDKALKAQSGTIARVTSVNGDHMDRQIKMIQGGIVSQTVNGVVPVSGGDRNSVQVTMTFDIDMKAGHDYGMMSAQNSTMKAHLGELADAAASNPVSNSALEVMTKQKYGAGLGGNTAPAGEAAVRYQALTSIAGDTATLRSGLATSSLGERLQSATQATCNKSYDVVRVSDLDIAQRDGDTVEGKATVTVRRNVDDCGSESFQLASWFGKSRTITPVSFRPLPGYNLRTYDTFSVNKEGRATGLQDGTGFSGIMCQGLTSCDAYRRLDAEIGDKGMPMTWGYHDLSVSPDAGTVVVRYFVRLPSSLLGQLDEMKFRVVPGA